MKIPKYDESLTRYSNTLITVSGTWARLSLVVYIVLFHILLSVLPMVVAFILLFVATGLGTYLEYRWLRKLMIDISVNLPY